ncbi:hypothetical protein D3C71_1461940 [compost metagenome]
MHAFVPHTSGLTLRLSYPPAKSNQASSAELQRRLVKSNDKSPFPTPCAVMWFVRDEADTDALHIGSSAGPRADLSNVSKESASDLLVVHNRPLRPHGLQPVGFDLELHNGLQLITLVEPPTQ